MKKYTKRNDNNIAKAGLANKGKKQTKQHQINKSRAMKESNTKNKIVCIQKIDGGKVSMFTSLAAAARYIGCSKQLTSQAAKQLTTYSAKGYIVRLLPISEALNIQTLG